MANDIVRTLNPNFAIPEGLKGVVTGPRDTDSSLPTPEAEIDYQFESLDDATSDLYEDSSDNDIDAPDDMQIISQTVRIAPDGSQVVDVVVEISEVRGAMKYDIRITKEEY